MLFLMGQPWWLQTAHSEKYLILASSCLPGATDHVDDPGVTRIQGLVNVPGTTFRMVSVTPPPGSVLTSE